MSKFWFKIFKILIERISQQVQYNFIVTYIIVFSIVQLRFIFKYLYRKVLLRVLKTCPLSWDNRLHFLMWNVFSFKIFTSLVVFHKNWGIFFIYEAYWWCQISDTIKCQFNKYSIKFFWKMQFWFLTNLVSNLFSF